MCLWFPLWPVQRLLAEPSELDGLASLSGGASPPIVLFAETRRGLFVTACSPKAARAGIHAGMPLGEARSLWPKKSARTKSIRCQERAIPKPIFHRADPTLDRTRLQRFALHCQRYSPLVGLEDVPEPESLWLDISGNEVLFGGELGLIETLRVDLAQQGFRARIAIADTWGAAWATSHFGSEVICTVPAAQQSKALESLPVAALRIADPVVESLQVLDVSTIGRLMCLPRATLPSRFGKDLLQRLDQALGLVPELLTAERLIEPLSTECQFDEPVVERQRLDYALGVLLDQLLGQLNDRRASLREMSCHWLGTTMEPIVLRLLRPTTDHRHLFELLRLQCERLVFTKGINGIRMEVVEMGLPAMRQTQLFEDDDGKTERYQHALAELVDRLGSRLGRQAVLRPTLRPDPQPEYACEYVPWLGGGTFIPMTAISHSHLRCRPLKLLQSPQPLIIEGTLNGPPIRVNHTSVVRIAGPERIEAGWWRGLDAKRDYYRLDLASGTGLWAFVDRDTSNWFLHGLFV